MGKKGGNAAPLGETYALHKGEWVKALTLPNTLNKVKVGTTVLVQKRSGLWQELPIGVYENIPTENMLL